ncbi:MAG: hypothetical protein M1368_03615 [Thaumarchaeota archaeon]|nr:hypothetical protein [Nitrososphaerota archaeon]
MTSFLQDGRFRWGVSVDNAWFYAGLPAPKSIIVPYLLSVRLPRGPFRLGIPSSLYKCSCDEPVAQGETSEREERCRQLAADLKQTGIQFVRAWFQWNLFEPRLVGGESTIRQFPMDDFVRELTQTGIEILGVIGNGYQRFLPEGLEANNVSDYVLRLKESSRQILNRYKGKVSAWQIENEPNWWLEHYATHWRTGEIWLEPGVQETILSELSQAVRETDPGSTVIINLEADHAKTSWEYYTKFCDVLGLDFYPNYSHSSPVDASKLATAAQIKQIAGCPVFIAETGYPSGPLILGYDKEKQAEYVRQVCEVARSTEGINGLSMWRFSDTYWHSFPDQENHFGLLEKNGEPKPAWQEYVQQIRQ